MPDAPVPTFDSVVLTAVVHEVRQRLPLRVLRVEPGGPYEVVLRTDRELLLLSADPAWPRVHFVQRRVSDSVSGAFADLLRARLAGSRVVAVEQPPFERVVDFHVQAPDGPYRLVAEPMGKHANLVLVREGTVVGAARPVPPERSRVRPLLPGFPYRPPPPDPRPKPGELDAAALLDCLHQFPQPLWRALLRCVAGVGPLLAYELAWRTGDPEATTCEPARACALAELLEELRDRVASGRFDPHLYGADPAPVAFAPFAYGCLKDLPARRVRMSEALERVADVRARTARLEAHRQALLSRIRALAERKTTALEQVRADLEQARNADRLREWGTLLLTYSGQVPKGASSVRLPGYQGEPVDIPLDPARSAVENAQEYFRRYAKLRAALRALPQRAAALQQEVDFLDSLRVHAECATTHRELEELAAELPGAPPRRRQAPRSAPRAFTVDGFQVLVGRSNRDNDRVTFQLAGPRDLWFHARGVPGAHVVLKTAGRVPAEPTLRRVAAVAAYYSGARTSPLVDVDYTERRFVRRVPGGLPGRVTYREERTLRVSPAPPEDL
ncbi:MAG: NFACT family protein [bacterium]